VPTGRRKTAAPDERVITTVAFTDIVGSTELAAELGDRRFRQVVAMHHSFVRGEIKRHGGREIDTAGDGFFVTFDQPARAIRCVASIVDGMWERGLRLRAGLHIGEVEPVGSKVGGVAVHIGSRVSSRAQPGEVLVSGTLHDLVAGSDLRFADRGSHPLKGVPGEWHLFAVVRESAPEGVPLSEPPQLGEQAESRRLITGPRLAIAGGALAVLTAGAFFLLNRGPAEVTPTAGTVGKLDPSVGHFTAAVRTGNGPAGVTVGDGDLWVLNAEDQTVSRVDPATETVVATRSVGGTPTGVAYGAGSLWIAAGFGLSSGDPGSVIELDPASNELGRPIPVGNGVTAIAFGSGSVWAVNKNANTVTRIDAATGATSDIPVGEGPEGIDVGAGAVWVANSLSQSVMRIDLATETVVQEIALRVAPSEVEATEGAVWVASSSGNTLVRIDPERNAVVTTIPVPAGPSALTASGEAVWVASSVAGSVSRIDVATNRRGDSVPVEGSPSGIVEIGGSIWMTVRE
jgi:YVTN family beta-propeller protein